MDKEFDLINLDKSRFVCLQFPDDSVYYGEMAYFNEDGRLVDDYKETQLTPEEVAHMSLEQQREAAQKQVKYKRLRHGPGVQIFYKDDKTVLCKYEGYWEKDEKHGFGKMVYPDQSYYEGKLNKGIKQGFGKYSWPNGHSYEGRWADDKMDGPGIFFNENGTSMSGNFKNNYYHAGGDIFISPFESGENIEAFLSTRKQKERLKNDIEREKNLKMLKIENLSDCRQQVLESNKNNRIPLVLSSKYSCYMNISQFISRFVDPCEFHYVFDLRKAAVLRSQSEKYRALIQEIKTSLAHCIAEGGVFILSLDESDVDYAKLFEPDIKDFYQQSYLPRELMFRKEMQTPEVFEKVLAGTPWEGSTFNEGFRIVIWSKYKIDENLDFEKISNTVGRRFKEILIFKLIDIFVVCNL